MVKEVRIPTAPCAVCQTTEDLVWDHNHETDVVRGVLCRKHNSALGMLNDDPKMVLSLLYHLSFANEGWTYSDWEVERDRGLARARYHRNPEYQRTRSLKRWHSLTREEKDAYNARRRQLRKEKSARMV